MVSITNHQSKNAKNRLFTHWSPNTCTLHPSKSFRYRQNVARGCKLAKNIVKTSPEGATKQKTSSKRRSRPDRPGREENLTGWRWAVSPGCPGTLGCEGTPEPLPTCAKAHGYPRDTLRSWGQPEKKRGHRVITIFDLNSKFVEHY